MSRRSRATRRDLAPDAPDRRPTDPSLHIRRVGFLGYEVASARHDRHRRALMAAAADDSTMVPLGRGGKRGPGSASDLGCGGGGDDGEEEYECEEFLAPPRRERKIIGAHASRSSAAARKRSVPTPATMPVLRRRAKRQHPEDVGEGISSRQRSGNERSAAAMAKCLSHGVEAVSRGSGSGGGIGVVASSSVDALDSALRCPLCHSHLADPFTVLCPHQCTFCSACLIRYILDRGASERWRSKGTAEILEVKGVGCPGRQCQKAGGKSGEGGGDEGAAAAASFLAMPNHALARVAKAYGTAGRSTDRGRRGAEEKTSSGRGGDNLKRRMSTP